jgi:hypothetical protein
MATTQNSATDDEARPEPLKEIRLKPDAFGRLAAGNRQFAKVHNGERRPNLAAIGRQAGMSRGNLAKFVNGDQPLTLNVVNLVIAASGLPWLDALADYFDYGVPDCQAYAGQREMAAA